MERVGLWLVGLLDRNGDERLVGLFDMACDISRYVHVLWES